MAVIATVRAPPVVHKRFPQPGAEAVVPSVRTTLHFRGHEDWRMTRFVEQERPWKTAMLFQVGFLNRSIRSVFYGDPDELRGRDGALGRPAPRAVAQRRDQERTSQRECPYRNRVNVGHDSWKGERTPLACGVRRRAGHFSFTILTAPSGGGEFVVWSRCRDCNDNTRDACAPRMGWGPWSVVGSPR